MRKITKYLVLLIAFMLMSCNKQEAKYVFFFIGDGMGTAHINAAERYLASVEGKSGIIKLNLNQTNYTGSASTYSQDQYITDSGAAGTALATGHKTSNYTLSMDAEHIFPYKTIAEHSKDKAMKVGIISSVSLNHSTPAAFYAHQPSKNNYYEIAKELTVSDLDFFGGGGLRDITDPKGIDPGNVVELAKENNYLYVNSATAFKYLEPGAGKVLFIHPDKGKDHALPFAIDASETSISLADITDKAIKMLDNEDGFFIMVEGGKIDWACHHNDAATTIHDIIAFDNAVKVALDFYEEHKENTLIIVTADHECGGLTLGTAGGDNDLELSKLQWQTNSFVKLTEEYSELKKDKELLMGADSMQSDSSWAFSFIYEKTALGDETKGLALDSAEVAELTKAYKRSFKARDRSNHEEYILYGPYDPFLLKTSHVLSRKVGLGWATYSHTAIPVPVRAFGVGAEKFTGYYDNTDIYDKLRDIMKF
ncbi:MAG: alkaline phosphatase [Candidatus Neomarinimicrobiota bacterium]|jgi:alkaline phosphatase